MHTALRLRLLAAFATALLLFTTVVGGCGKKPAESVTGPGSSGPSNPSGGTAPGPGAQPPATVQHPAPYSGKGLPDPYINDKGEIELIFADARGTVKVGKGRASAARVSPDRTKLAYAALEGDRYEEERVYILDASSEPWRETRTEWHDFPICELSFSPCGQYLSVDAGTSVVRGLSIIRVTDGAVIAVVSVYSRAAWSPGTPSRLAMGLVTNRPIAPVTELDRTVDAVVLELPSGRLTYLKRGTGTEFWSPLEWVGNDRIKLGHDAVLPRNNSTEIVAAAAQPLGEDTAPGRGPLPVDADPRPEINIRRELLLASPGGTVLRQLTNHERGAVVDYALSNDGRILSYAWQASSEDQIRLFNISLPDLGTTEVELGPAPAGARNWGPKRLAFAPGSRPLLLADWGARATVYDLRQQPVQVADFPAESPLWAPRSSAGDSPLLICGQYQNGGPFKNIDDRLALICYNAESGVTTTLLAATGGFGYLPVGFADDGTVLVYREGSVQDLIRVKLPD